MTIRAGKLRHEIVIQKTTQTQSTSGAFVDSWATFATVRASIEPLNGKEYFDSQQVNAEENIRFRIRYLPNLTTKMRISWDSRIFDIRSIINTNERNRELILMVVEDV